MASQLGISQGARTVTAIMRRVQRCSTQQHLQKATPEALVEMSDGVAQLARIAPDYARQPIVNLSSEISRRLTSPQQVLPSHTLDTLRSAETKLAQLQGQSA